MPFKYNITFPKASVEVPSPTEEGTEKIFTRSLYVARLALQEEAGLLDTPTLSDIEVFVTVGLKADASGS